MTFLRTAAVGLTLAAFATGCSSGTTSSDGASATSGASGSASATLPEQQQAAFQKVLDDTRSAQGFPGVQAGVWTPDGAWIGTSGTSGQGLATPITEADHTRIGSVTKTFTVTALLQLAEKGELSLDDTIGKYVPGVPNADSATLANLAAMTSGIPSYSESQTFTDAYFAKPETVWQPQQLVDLVKGQPASFAPGTQYYYSNTNTVLLGMVIEQVTGQAVAQVFTEQIFTPLGLQQTSFPAASAALPAPFLSGITEQGQPDGKTADATNWNPSWAFTAGEMISTLDDLHAWSKALATGEGVLGKEYAQKRLDSLNTTVAPNTAEKSYGLGFGQVNGWIGHTGELPGYNTTVYYHPESKTSIVVMVNSDIATAAGENPAPAVTTGLMQIVDGGGSAAASAAASGSQSATTSRAGSPSAS
ncbi:MAG: serine hydrolase domain-containing protein [Candidatus Nanopelagicales bacterium]